MAVVLGYVAVHGLIGRTGQADRGVDAPAGLSGLGPCHHAEGDLAGLQRLHALVAFEMLAAGRQDGRDGDQVLLLDIGIAQRQLESGELLAMDPDAAGQEEAGRNRKHGGRCRTITGLWADGASRRLSRRNTGRSAGERQCAGRPRAAGAGAARSMTAGRGGGGRGAAVGTERRRNASRCIWRRYILSAATAPHNMP